VNRQAQSPCALKYQSCRTIGNRACHISTVMQNIYLLLIILLSAVSCKQQKSPEQPLAAQQSAVKVRDHWKAEEKPVVIQVEGVDQYTLEQLGSLSVTTATEKNAFPYRGKSNTLHAEDSKLLTPDSSVTILLCFPYRKNYSAHDTLHLKQPFGEQLYGLEVGRMNSESLKVSMELRSSLSLLRIQFVSDKLQDMLDELRIYGETLVYEADYLPYSGKWLNGKENGFLTTLSDDCLLNNGRNHDFYLVPTGNPVPITLFAKINQVDYAVKTTLPPLHAGGLIQLNVEVGTGGNLHIASSWVENERKISLPTHEVCDSIKVGYYLQKDGTVSKSFDSLSMALVIGTDGRHGKAVALKDEDGMFVFGNGKQTTGKLFPTIDGKRKEGILNPLSDEAAGEEERIIFKPDMPYPDDCALGYDNGASLTQRLSMQTSQRSLAETLSKAHTGLFMTRKKMLSALSRYNGCYIPSLGEMAGLYYQLQPYSGMKMPEHFTVMQGEYLTASESSEHSFYMMDMNEGIIHGSASKSYSKGRIRLFYLF